jgi:hypothetical protein
VKRAYFATFQQWVENHPLPPNKSLEKLTKTTLEKRVFACEVNEKPPGKQSKSA